MFDLVIRPVKYRAEAARTGSVFFGKSAGRKIQMFVEINA
jgi:hypothetical protein